MSEYGPRKRYLSPISVGLRVTQDGVSPMSLLLHIPLDNGRRKYGELYGANIYQVMMEAARLFCSYGAVWDETCQKRLQYMQDFMRMFVDVITELKVADTVAKQVESLVIEWKENDAEAIGYQNPVHVLSGLRACIQYWALEHQSGLREDEFADVPLEIVLHGEHLVVLHLNGS